MCSSEVLQQVLPMSLQSGVREQEAIKGRKMQPPTVEKCDPYKLGQFFTPGQSGVKEYYLSVLNNQTRAL